jgi:hypothetical protein
MLARMLSLKQNASVRGPWMKSFVAALVVAVALPFLAAGCDEDLAAAYCQNVCACEGTATCSASDESACETKVRDKLKAAFNTECAAEFNEEFTCASTAGCINNKLDLEDCQDNDSFKCGSVIN